MMGSGSATSRSASLARAGLQGLSIFAYIPHMTAHFDRSVFATAPVITVPSGITLALALYHARPPAASPGIEKAAAHLKKVADGAQGELVHRNSELGASPDEDSRALDADADRCWRAFRLRGQALAMLPPDAYPQAKRALALDSKLFPQGTEFLKSDYAAQRSSMATVLQTIDEEGLEKEVNALLGPEFLAAVREVQPRYSAMVDERLRRDKASGQNLLETIRAIQSAIVNYAGKVIGAIEHDDPATVETARLALLPILNHRDAVAAAQRAAKATPAPAGTPPAPAAPSADAKPVPTPDEA